MKKGCFSNPCTSPLSCISTGTGYTCQCNCIKYNMARNFYCDTFFGQIFNRNNLRFIKARILGKKYFNRSRFCFLDFKIIFNLEKYFWEFIHVWKSILIFKINNFSLKIYQVEHKLLNNSCPQSRLFYLIKI